MLLTEEEARKEVCPLIRYCVNEMGVVQDKDGPIYTHQTCQGSDCKMGWRWAGPPPSPKMITFRDNPHSMMGTPPHRPEGVPASWAWSPYNTQNGTSAHFREPVEEAVARRRGYCGAFGKPEAA